MAKHEIPTGDDYVTNSVQASGNDSILRPVPVRKSGGVLSRFSGLFGKAAPTRAPSDDPGVPSVYQKGRVVVITYPDVINAQEALKHPVVGRCVDIIAKAVQSVTWFAEEDPDASPDERRDNKRAISSLNSVLRFPNDRMTGENFRYWMTQNYALYARVPFVVGVGAVGGANGLYPLDARLVSAVLDGRGLLSSYEYGTGTNVTAYPIRRKANGAPYLHEIARPRLDGTFTGSTYERSNSVLSSIALPAQIITLLLQRAIDTASGHPNTKYIVVAEKTLTKKQKEALADHVENMAPGQDESGNILILYNSNVQVHKLDNSLTDIHSKMPMDDMTRLIAGAMGIPIALVGIGAADAAKFAGNYAESRRVFWADTVIPGYLSPFATGMTHAICPPGVRVRYDYDSIDALRDHNIANAAKLEPVTFLSNDEKRELIGFSPTKQEANTTIPSKAPSVATPTAPPASE